VENVIGKERGRGKRGKDEREGGKRHVSDY
jgi:hypothetical protein